MNRKEKLIQDIENLLNTHDGVAQTSIDINLLEFMDEETLISIISSLLEQKEELQASEIEWLEQFKSHSKAN